MSSEARVLRSVQGVSAPLAGRNKTTTLNVIEGHNYCQRRTGVVFDISNLGVWQCLNPTRGEITSTSGLADMTTAIMRDARMIPEPEVRLDLKDRIHRAEESFIAIEDQPQLLLDLKDRAEELMEKGQPDLWRLIDFIFEDAVHERLGVGTGASIEAIHAGRMRTFARHLTILESTGSLWGDHA